MALTLHSSPGKLKQNQEAGVRPAGLDTMGTPCRVAPPFPERALQRILSPRVRRRARARKHFHPGPISSTHQGRSHDAFPAGCTEHV